MSEAYFQQNVSESNGSSGEESDSQSGESNLVQISVGTSTVLTEVLRCFPQFLHLKLGRDLFLPYSFKIILHRLTIPRHTFSVSNSSVMPRSWVVTGVNKVSTALALRRGANVQNDNICCGSLRTGFRYCGRRQYSGSLLKFWE